MNARREFDRVFDDYFKSVYAYFSLCFSPGAAEDCAQQVFLNVWRALRAPGARLPANWRAWVFRLAVNVKNDRLRRQYAAPREQAYEEAALPDSAGPDIAGLAVREAFARLGESDREVLLLKSQGFTGAEIGGLLGLSASAARSRLAAARARFRATLAENGVTVDG